MNVEKCFDLYIDLCFKTSSGSISQKELKNNIDIYNNLYKKLSNEDQGFLSEKILLYFREITKQYNNIGG